MIKFLFQFLKIFSVSGKSNWSLNPTEDPIYPMTPLDRKLVPTNAEGSKDIRDCHEKLQQAYPIVKAQFETDNPEYKLQMDYTYRSPELQFSLFQKGRSCIGGQWVVSDKSKVVTNLDGTTKKSHHNTFPTQAMDILILKNGQILWSNDNPDSLENKLYIKLGQLFVQQGLISGATWKYQWKDWDHIQLSYDII